MSSNLFWMADGIGQSIDQARSLARSNRQLALQKSYYLGSVILVRALIAEVRRLDPQSVLLNSSIQDRISGLAQTTFFRQGWNVALALDVDVDAVIKELQAEHQAEISRALAEPVVTRRTLFFGPHRFVWRGRKHRSKAEAEATKAAEIRKLTTSKLDLSRDRVTDLFLH